MDGIVIKIPIDQVINVFSVAILLPLVFHLWRRTRENFTPSLSAFRWFFVCILLMMTAFATPFLIIKDLTLVQMSQNLAHFFFMAAVAFLLRSRTLLFGFHRRLFTFYTPVLILIIGAILFLWQINVLGPSIPTKVLTVGPLVFFDLWNSAPFLSNLIPGMIGFVIFATGTILFFWTYFWTSEKILRRRSFFLGLGHFSAFIAVTIYFIAGQISGMVGLFTIAAIATMISILLVYRGVLLPVLPREIT